MIAAGYSAIEYTDAIRTATRLHVRGFVATKAELVAR